MHQPFVQIFLQSDDRLIEFGPKCGSEKLIKHGAVESFHKPIGLRLSHFRGAMLYVIER